MARTKEKKFKWKGFFSFFALFVIIILFLTGIVLYFKPPGRIANWTHWTFLGLLKEQWQAIHTIFSITFVIISGFHLYYNWKVLMSYFKKKLQNGIHLKRELLLSSVLTILILVFTLVEIPPFSTIMIWGEDLSNSWSSEQSEPPIPHAEDFTLEELAESENTTIDNLINKLKSAGIEPKNDQEIVSELAKRYDLTPKQLFDKLEFRSDRKGSQRGGRGFGGGFGRKTVSQLCKEANIPVETGLERLKQKNINAKQNDNLRNLADDYSITPIEIANIIQGDKSDSQKH